MVACTSPASSVNESSSASSPSNQKSSSTVTLTSHYWDLHSTKDANGKVTSPVHGSGKKAPRLTFTEDRVVVDRICNVMSGLYEASKGSIEVKQVVSTMIGCIDKDVVKLEQYVGSHLTQMRSYLLQSDSNQPSLILNFKDGTQWTLVGTATPETLYGGPGERIFLEVAPQRKTCTDGVSGSKQCLQVREIRYNEKWLKNFTGEWQNFYSEIEGFEHRPGEHNLLRLNRYERKNAPADASRYVYILDMVVENGRAN